MVKVCKHWWRSAILGLMTGSGLVACGQNAPTPVTPTPTAQVQGELSTQASTNGLTGVYYNNADFTGGTVTQVDTTINKSWGTGKPVNGIDPTTYSVRWTGQISPAYSEAYTFSLTSSGGARLLIDGQVVVDDWAEHQSKVTSGVINLVAGTKYDIRLEYFRGTAQPGRLSLAWKSARRTQQTVPTSNLFSGTEKNLDTLLTAIRANKGYMTSGGTLNSTTALATRTETGIAGFAIEPGGTNFVFSSLGTSGLEYLYRYSEQGGVGTFSDLSSGKSVALGAMTAYVNADGTHTEQQYEALAQKIALFFSEGKLQAGTSSNTSGQLKAQGWTEAFWCNNNVIAPPPECGDKCKANAESYKRSICGIAAIPTDLILARFSKAAEKLELNKFWKTVNTGVAQGASPVTYGNISRDLYLQKWAYASKWDAYINCIKTNTECFPVMTPIPNAINITARVRGSGQLGVILGNSPEVLGLLYAYPTYTNETGGISFTSNPMYLRPGAQGSIEGGFVCGVEPQRLKAILHLESNATNAKIVDVPVTVECQGPQPKLQADDQLTISAPVGEIATGGFEISNVGDFGSVLDYTISAADLTLSPTSGTLTKDQTAAIIVSKACDTAGAKQYEAVIRSNHPNVSPKKVTVTVDCKGFVKENLMLATYNLTGDGGGAGRVDVRDSEGRPVGYYYISVGSIQIYGSGGTAYYHFRGGNGLVGIIYEQAYSCQTSMSMEYVFYTEAARAEIQSCLGQEVNSGLRASIPHVSQAIDRNKSAIPLYGTESIVNLRIGQHEVYRNIGIIGDVR